MLSTLAFGVAMAASPSTEAAPSRIDEIPLVQLDGTPLPAATIRGKAVLVVNVASFCGYTGQYSALQELTDARTDDGLVVVGVPCNQFGAQEPGSSEEIASFCKDRFGVTFPLLEKQDVNGPKRSPLYDFLVGSQPDIRWNFEKFVVGRDGTIVERFGSGTTPDSDELRAAIDLALKREPTRPTSP